jgi:hypothetical protein
MTMAVDDTDLHLDGNAAAGWLADLFRVEMTLTEICCAGCGTVGPVGALINYGHGMGVILRCPTCDTAVVRVARIHDRYWLDLRGSTTLRVAVPSA